ncbi:hypothetical protein [Roseicella aquatilis]|uniref:Flagellar assembly protein FliH/Type III secretion system HrpE domain-containing protein n=1 Tax=Roseicella aquatilis TaxID=2527868 RepID=A0A4R4DQC4_9PROT|nr:hypothetical protein [Roseicella aquatilis]TCZ63283.1 hypothetical protein EXY23_10685 [Roseicella aquatilis]
MSESWRPALVRPRPPVVFEPVLPGPPSAAAASPVLAFALRDFDAPPPPPAPDPEAVAAEAMQARLAAAREAGFAEGEATTREAMAAGLAAREAAALERIAAAMAEGAAQARAAAGEAAEVLARTLLAALDAALPEAAARLAPDVAARLAAELRPLLEDGFAVTLRVAPGATAAAAARIGDPRLTIAEDAALPPGDARAAWRGGGALVSLAARRQAVAALLQSFDLQEA